MSAAYQSRIVGVRFMVSGTEDNIADSVVEINKVDLYKGGMPHKGGPYDRHLGTTSHEYPCETCRNDKRDCTGHDGHLRLNQPVISPMFLQEIKKWIRLICFSCGAPIVDPSAVAHIPIAKRLDEAQKLARSSFRLCPVCRVEHPKIKTDVQRPLMILTESSTGQTSKMFPHHLETVLSRITDATVIAFGKQPVSHPRKFILRAIKIPPTAIRPDVRKTNAGRSANDDLTTLIINIIRRNEKLSAVLPDVISDELEENIFALCDTYFAYVRGSHSKRVITSGSAPLNSLAFRLKGKQGLFRKHMQGKRVKNVARTTISGNPTRKLDEITMPVKFAKNLQIEETVQEFNRERLTIAFLNGTKRYPGCSKIIRARTGTEHNVEDPHAIPDLEVGDVLMRDLVDGDYVYFNRQPSLLPSALSGMRVVITHDPRILTIQFNVISCSLFNADFDGDQMNVFVGANLASRIEIEHLAAAPNFFIKHANSAPLIGQTDDSIIGSFLLTRSHVEFDRYHAMRVFSSTSLVPTLPKQARFGTRELTSLHLADTPVNYSGPTTYYVKPKPGEEPITTYDPNDTRVVIERGKHVSGVLDGATVGKGKVSGLYHLISTRFGEKKVFDVIFDLQQMAISYLQMSGFSIGIKDLIVTDETLREIHDLESGIIGKARAVTERLNDGKIIPPINMTIEEFYEEQQIQNLKILDDFAKPIFRDMRVDANNLMQLVLSGSKGKMSHVLHICGGIGQIVINGRRPRKQLAHGRTFPHFKRFDMSPEANGFVSGSYVSGMNANEFAFNAQNARADFTTKVLYTSVTGESERKSIKNLESLTTNNFRMCVKHNNIVQLVYGDCGLDSRRLVRVVIPTVTCSIADLEAGWHYKPADATSIQTAAFAAEYARVKSDRDEFRNMFLRIEKGKYNEEFSATKGLAMDIDKLVSDIFYEFGEQKPTTTEIASMVETTSRLATSISYIMINEIQERAGTPIPEHLAASNWMLSLYIRACLNSQRCLHKMTPAMLAIIVDRVRLRQSRALVAYGATVGIIAALSFSEPLTQYMLDAHHRTTTGGTSKSQMSIVRDILGAKSAANLSDPKMWLVPIGATTEAELHRVANHIEVMCLRNFVRVSQIFYEKYGEPVHPSTKHEGASLIKFFERLNPLMKPPADLLKWCLRFTLNRFNMIYKNMPLETIVSSLRDKYPDLYFVYSPENATTIVLRVYIKTTYFDKHVEQDSIESLREWLLDTPVRGVTGIASATVVEMPRHHVDETGAITKQTSYCVETAGTNLEEALWLTAFDPYQVQTNAIEEITNILGIEAARQKLNTSIRNLGAGGLNAMHVSVYVDVMTYTGVVTSIEKQGLSKREINNVLLRMGASHPIQVLEEAAVNSIVDPMQGVTSALLVGDIPHTVGTAYNRFHINEALVRANTTRPDDWLDAL